MLDFFAGKSKQIEALIKAGKEVQDGPSRDAFVAQVYTVFKGTIHNKASLIIPSGPLLLALEEEILNELCHVIGTLSLRNTYFVRNFKQVIEQLARACYWKISVRNIRLRETNPEKTDELGQIWKPTIRRWMAAYAPNRLALRNKRLLDLLNDREKDEIASRLVRAVIAFYQKNDQPLFVLNHENLELGDTFRRMYLSDQIALYIYLFKDKEEALFILEAAAKNKQWVRQILTAYSDLDGSELEKTASDIVSQVQIEFIQKYDRQIDPANPFYLDVQLTTFLQSFIKKKHDVEKALARMSERRGIDDQIDRLDDESGQDVPDRTPDENREEQLDVLNVCLSPKSELKPECRQLFVARYNNLYSEERSINDMTDQFGKTTRELHHLYDTCRELLLQCVKRELTKRQLIIRPR